jgi:hypothetical protein
MAEDIVVKMDNSPAPVFQVAQEASPPLQILLLAFLPNFG